MEIILSKKSGKGAMEIIADQLGATMHEDCHEYSCELPPEVGNGTIRMVDFFNGMSILIMSCQWNNDVEIKITESANALMRYNYCLEGGIDHQLLSNQTQYCISTLNGSVTTNLSQESQSFLFTALQKTDLVSIEIDRYQYLSKIRCDVKYLPDKFEQAFKDIQGKESFLYTHPYTHEIHEEASNILTTDLEGIVRRTSIESCALNILSNQIMQYLDHREGHKKLIRENEVVLLKKAKEIIHEKFKEGIQVSKLSKEVGLNMNKLKNGFKQVYGLPINKYLQKIRMEKAKVLLAADQLSISEIAWEVGYENRSYLSRKFKEFTGYLPKDFRKKVRNLS